MNYIIFDLEYTAWDGAERRLKSAEREVIQIGAIKINFDDTDINIVSTFQEFVKPTVNPQLSDYIINLTGITQQNVEDQGLTLHEALNKFEIFCSYGKNKTFSWGDDSRTIKKNTKLIGIEFPSFLANNTDLTSRIPMTIDQYNLNVSSGNLYRSVGLNLEFNNHDALDDTKSIFETLKFLHLHKKIDLNYVLK